MMSEGNGPFQRTMEGRREVISSVAVAVDRDKNSRFALKYALENCLIPRDEVIKLVHVKLRSAESVEAVDQVATTVEIPDSFVPFRCFCICKKMQSEMVVLEDYDVATALVNYVRSNHIRALFLGEPSRGSFSRLFKKVSVPRMVMRSAPSFCNVYIIGKGDVASTRPATLWITPPILPPQQSQNPPQQHHHYPLPEHSRTSYDEVEDDVSVSSGRLSTESDFISFYESFETGGMLPTLDTDLREDECEELQGKLKSTSPRRSPTMSLRGYEGT